jgi:hypothetical protein
MRRAQRFASCRGVPDIEPERSSTIAKWSGRRGTELAEAAGAWIRASTRNVVECPAASAGRSGIRTSLNAGCGSLQVGMIGSGDAVGRVLPMMRPR